MGVGYTLCRAGYAPIVRVGIQIGPGTNNIAEYQALLHGMRAALRFGMWKLRIQSDSMLVVKQFCRSWKVRDASLARLLAEAHMLTKCFAGPPWMSHIPREDNGVCDALSRNLENEAPRLPQPPNGRALLRWQAAGVNVWWHNKGVRSAAFLSKIFGIQDVQIDQIVTGRSYADASFDGLPSYAPERFEQPEFPHHPLRAVGG